MKLKSLLPAFAAIILLGFASCKKTDNTADSSDYETTFELSADQGIADNLTQDANDILNEVTNDNNLQGSGFIFDPNQSQNFVSCAAVTVTPASGFPKTITIDFGTSGCTSQSGVTRSGIITVTLSDSLRHSGSVATMTFSNYYVSGWKKEGTITWTNTSANGVKSWRRVCTNGKITAPAPSTRYWLHSGTQDIIQTAGSSTPSLLDDVFTITGGSTVTNAAGISRTATILTPLQKKFICSNIDMGTMKIQGPNHYAVINYGDGTCDNIATISIDGRPERTFQLR
jgi:hypothetical protein